MYVLVCPCALMYVGSTIFPLRKRILEHQRAIRSVDFTYPVAGHFYETHNSDPGKLVFFAIDRVSINVKGGDRVMQLRL